MEIDGYVKEIKKGITLADDNPNYEFECVLSQLHESISKTQFSNLHNYLRNSAQFTLTDTDNQHSLDISIQNSDLRVTVAGQAQYNIYCKSNSFMEISAATLLQKGRVNDFKTLHVPEYDLYFKMRYETTPSEPVDLSSFDTQQKFYRRKMRFSFLHANRCFRVDLTVVKSSQMPAVTIQGSGMLGARDAFEIEIEYLPKSKSSQSVLQKVGDLLSIIDVLKQSLEDTSYLMSNREKELVMCEYLKLVNPTIFGECDINIGKFIRTKVMPNPRNFFLSYQPITLEQQNIMPPKLGVVSVLENYSVTEKADGERALLYVDRNNNTYLINSRLNIRKLGNKHQLANSLLDGEFVKRSKIANVAYNTFLIFDAYFINGSDIRNNDLLKRIDSMTAFEKNQMGKSEINIKVKKHHYGSDIFKLSNGIYKSLKYDYHIDGLIFTPMSLSVGSHYVGEPAEANTFGGTWTRLFKWKPPEENSIDMLTTYDDTEKFLPGVGRCVFARLHVAYNANQDALIDPYIVLAHGKLFKKHVIEPKVFKEIYMPLKDGDSKPRTAENEVIYNNTIVEYVYDPTDSGLMSWKPYRVRIDKTTLYNQSNSIAGTANNYNTAMNVWRSILHPVTLDHITGNVTLTSNDVSAGNVYYARNVSRKKIMSKPMLDFHGKVKEFLFDLFKNRNYSLIDMACGKGGDLLKWVNARLAPILGVDINLDNIMNNNDGAYRRLYTLNSTQQSKHNVLFLQKDVSQTWDDINSIENETMFDLYKLVSRNEAPNSTTFGPKSKVKHFQNILHKGFDVVSCQFAIHYMFKNDQTLDTFCNNVDKVLKKNGYFIGTCLDGRKVAELLDSSNDGKRAGVLNGNTLWMLEKKYDGAYAHNKTGQTISVYIESINQIIDEYLVDLQLLEHKLAKHDIKVLSEKDLSSLNLPSAIGPFEKLYDASKFQLPDILKQFSFLNTWFVFKKY